MSGFIPRRRYLMYRGELRDIARAWLRGRVADPRPVRQFEQALSAYHGIAHVRTVNSGRIGLLVLLEALGLRPGDEILVPAYTLKALIELLQHAGYVPVPVDIDPQTFNLDPQAARDRIGPATRAILATHLFGRGGDVEGLARLARRSGLLLVEDCAQALGTRIGGRPVGTFGDGAILSFDLLKPINTFGGGAVLTPHREVDARVGDALRNLAQPLFPLARRLALGLAEHAVLVTPAARLVATAFADPRVGRVVERAYRSMQDRARPTASRYFGLQAQIGLRLLDSLDARVAVRRDMARKLAALLGERAAASVERGENGYFFVRLTDGSADGLRRDLLAAGIDAGIGSEVADYCGDLGRAAECPVARDVAAHAIQLPLHEGLTDTHLRRIADVCAGRLRAPALRAARPLDGD
ncbi:MAG: aminotransferase class I/II-fold pyridoxal phosphate-dependent enzyme [Aromatoleum sp.]|jgi:dTDP-4-amino-4,6-dideoxygalactose transaminase|uniref:DegT/DnrJ/EryC1/StrS family aminotransferase n=1 Tax=Aromatoleum sp. TaxID=2307007 RepID=UPI002893C417|nr:aminotransferase class I/II-fold pyridoxal phosphate-dependent enzyme [Aromatoleum sp.]MDT3670024.1 aminotransferase class I/II-fold pyridoxal phosphate-dependent enzyme [Aromatoleum sp.]